MRWVESLTRTSIVANLRVRPEKKCCQSRPKIKDALLGLFTMNRGASKTAPAQAVHVLQRVMFGAHSMVPDLNVATAAFATHYRARLARRTPYHATVRSLPVTQTPASEVTGVQAQAKRQAGNGVLGSEPTAGGSGNCRAKGVCMCCLLESFLFLFFFLLFFVALFALDLYTLLKNSKKLHLQLL